MTRYRMRIYKAANDLWQTHDIFAEDETTAKIVAKQKLKELLGELTEQKVPKIGDPTLERFSLYEGDRLICEMVYR
jgi:hypothetical protein